MSYFRAREWVYSPTWRGLQPKAAGFTGRGVLCCMGLGVQLRVYSCSCGFRVQGRVTNTAPGLQPVGAGLQRSRNGGVHTPSLLDSMLISPCELHGCKVYSPRCWVYSPRWRGLQVVAFYVVFSSTGQGLQPEVRVYSPRCGFTGRGGGVYRSFAFYVVFSSTGQGLQPEVRVNSLRCGVYRSRRRGLQVVAFYVDFSITGGGFTARGARLQPEVQVYRSRRRGLQVVRFYVVWVLRYGCKVCSREVRVYSREVRVYKHGSEVYRRSCGFTGQERLVRTPSS